jgi:hypothetical protein
MHLTWGDLRRESVGGVSRGRSSEESRRKAEGAKGRRTKRERSTDRLDRNGREGGRNGWGAATTAATPTADQEGGGGLPRATGPRRPSPPVGGRR